MPDQAFARQTTNGVHSMSEPHHGAKPWSHYWKSGKQDAYSLGSTGRQADAISRDWRSYFDDLPEKSSILDIGTGNGTLALLAAKSFSHRKAAGRIMGIDAADIHPDLSSLGNSVGDVEVAFQGGMAAEALAFEDKVFDEIVGQYALEYTDVERSIPEVDRVLSSGGRVRFLVHSNDSLVIKNASEDFRALDVLLNELALVHRARRVFEVRARRGKVVKKTQTADQRFLQALQELQRRVLIMDPAKSSQHYKSFLETMRELFQRRVSQNPVQYLTFLDQFEEEMQHAKARLSQMAAAAKDEAGAEKLLALFSGSGLEDLTLQKQNSSDTTFGWLLLGRKI
jgi:ubiquinone/menaquinone biosynthesis C-methylase UbiE